MLWKKMPKTGEVPAGRIGAGIVYYDNSIYMWGTTEDNHTLEEDQRLYKYDLYREIWEIVDTYGSLPEPRNHHGVAIIGSMIYVYLGIDDYRGKELSSTYKVNLFTGLWERVPIIGEKINRNKFGNVQSGTCVWVICGTNTTSLFNSIYKYNFTSNTLTTVISNTKMLKRRHSYSFNKISKNFILFGGYDHDTM